MNLSGTTHTQFTRWRSPLLLIVINLLFWESLSGFVLFFFGSFMEPVLLSRTHWIAGFLSLMPYSAYQWNHYMRVRKYSGRFHYKLGLFSFISFCLVTISGIPLLLTNITESAYTIIDLVHTVLSFVFLIMLSGHLVLVARITIARSNKKAPVRTGASKIIWKLVFWLPLAISLVILLSVIFYTVL